ncbi:MAG: hypothetical protein AMJ65_00310 [Phycisphaerae bacterium SG8_4]|nr:MAG: hypothetical protein AMJ65_00310 [Phycisphaerae bacterium SG8_4]
MKTRNRKTSVAIALVGSLVLSVCGGCSSDSSGGGRLKLHPIYESALWGAAIGAIVGYQSDETGEGAAVGAALFGVGTLLQQTDKMTEQQEEDKHEDQEEQEVVIQIQNDNGSMTPVVLKKEGGSYVGPNGEHYDRLPTAEQLKPVYGL